MSVVCRLAGSELYLGSGHTENRDRNFGAGEEHFHALLGDLETNIGGTHLPFWEIVDEHGNVYVAETSPDVLGRVGYIHHFYCFPIEPPARRRIDERMSDYFRESLDEVFVLWVANPTKGTVSKRKDIRHSVFLSVF